MSKQRVMDDLDALLAELQSTTSVGPTYRINQATLSTDSLTRSTPAVIMDSHIPPRPAPAIPADAVDSEGQPIYQLQTVKPMSTSFVTPAATFHSSPLVPPHALYASVQKQPKTAGAGGTVALSSNLSELDTLLQELSSAQLESEIERRNSTTANHGGEFVGKSRSVDDQLHAVASSSTPKYSAASSATKELDDLMASLSDLDVQGSPALSYGATSPPSASEVSHPSPPASQTDVGQPVPAPVAQNVVSVQSAVSPEVSGNVVPSTVTSASGGISLNALMEDLDKSMTQQGVTTVPKGHCAACHKPIVGQVITALARLWHPEHFVCGHCKEPLGTRNFFERDAMPYCERDYHVLFSPRCASCGGPILDKCVTAMDKTWHPEHFLCAQCGRELGPEAGFHERNGQPYCREDYYGLFAPKCGGCGRPIVDNFITALNQQWHTECFVCFECRSPFGAASFYEHEGLPYCETHFHARRGSLCASCRKPVTGRCITAMYRKYHPEHFVCTFCQRQLNKGTFKEQNDKPYCHPCFVRLFS